MPEPQPPQVPEPEPSAPRRHQSPLAVKVLTTLAVLATIYWTRSLVVPVLIGVLVSYALNPFVETLTRLRVPRSLASFLVMISLLGGIAGMIYSLSDEATSALRSVPAATKRLRQVVERAIGPRQNVVGELQSAADAVTQAANGGGEQQRRRAGEPMPVEVVEPAIDVKEYVWMGWQSLFAVAGQGLLVVFLSFFMLSSGDLYRRKLVRLAGARLSKRRVTVEILDEVGEQVSLFLIHQVMTGTLVGVATWLVFWWLGVEYAALWGVVAGVMNTIPYFGPTVVAIAAFAFTFVQFESARQATFASAASLAITTLEGMLVTPLLISRMARMNPVAVFLGLLFWGWLWGVVGMLLAVPLLMTIKSVADRVEDLKPLGELLGD